MRFRLWPEDTIAWRFALTVVLSIVVAVALAGVTTHFIGVWARPSAHELGLFERADDIVRMIEATSEPRRPALVKAADNAAFRVNWYPRASTVAVMLDAVTDPEPKVNPPAFQIDGHQRRLVRFTSTQQGELLAELHFDIRANPDAFFAAVELNDASWVVFMAPTRFWGVGLPVRIGVVLGLLIISIAAVSAVATLQLARPIRKFTDALRRFGTDPRAALLPETGPREVRASIGAFNAMQAQIQKFVDDRTAMLAAISHDLRTPLTRMRLRAEFVEDEDQRVRLCRDVDEMQAMVASALAFFRDDFQAEETTTFDFPELLRTIAEDYSDQGFEITYIGTKRVAFRGRPLALKRAFANLVDNAVKYGRAPGLELRCSEQRFVVVVSDSGPGIPPEYAQKVFTPFYRLERSRNRATGGVGLGLTSAQAVIRGHGGEICLRNRSTGGLEVEVTLPVVSWPQEKSGNGSVAM
jgi:signal transduction histidine kinase